MDEQRNDHGNKPPGNNPWVLLTAAAIALGAGAAYLFQWTKGLRGTEGKLNNENFVSRAKPEVVEQARAKLKEFQDQLAAIEKHIAEIED